MKKILLTTILSLLIPFAVLAQEAYAVYTTDGTLTFYYDKQKSSRSGKKYAMNTGNNNPGWYTDHRQDIKKVVFNSSFAEARPTSTHCWFSVPVLEGSKLSEIIGIQYLNTSEVTDMSYMFSQCSYLSSIDVTHFNTEKVTDMSFMFYYCDRLTSLDVTHFNTGKVTEMDGMFEHCSKMTSLDVTHFITENVTSMAAMFQDCSKLMSLDVTHFNTDNLTVMRRMFSGCTSLSSVDLSNFNTKNVTDMFGVFYLCSSIKTIYADEALWSTDKVTNSGSMFYGCTRLVGGNGTKFDSNHVDKVYAHVDGGISYPGYFTSKISTAQTNEAYAVYTDDGTLTFYYDKQKSSRSGTKYELNSGENAPGWYTDHCEDIKKVVFTPSFSNARPTSTCWWFSGKLMIGTQYHYKSNLSEIEGIEYLNTSNVTNMENMFFCCAKLTGLDVSHFNTSNVTNMKSMFSHCRSLTNLDVSNFDTRNVTDMREMFYYCQSLTSLDVSNFDTRNVTDMRDMFDNCQSLTSLDVSNFDTRNVINMSYMFYGCESLTTIYVGNGWNTDKVIYSDNMFSGCSNLVGGAGTKYDANHRDVAYAHIDGGASNPGYLTDKNKKEKVCDADDLGRFLRNLSGSQSEVDIPLCDEATIDEDVEVDDDLMVFIDGLGKNPPQRLLFAHSFICYKNVNSNWTFRSITFANKDDATGGGIKNVGALTFRGCTFMSGDYVIENLSGGRLVFSEGTVVEGQGNIINSGSVYVDGTVSLADMQNKQGGRIYITSSLTKDIHICIEASDVELGVPIIFGGEGYSLTEADLSHIHLTLPVGYEWKYDAVQGGIVISQATGMISINAGQPDVVDSYDATGRKVGIQHNGLTLQRKSDGTVKKVIIK